MPQGFFITRVAAPGEPLDMCAPLEFWPPKGSDALHEALKVAYPNEANLSSRMRQAVIDFLLTEQQSEKQEEYQQFQSPVSADTLSPEYLPSPQSTFVFTIPSPSNSGTQISQQLSAPPAQQEMMAVWSLPTTPGATKIHTRRTMTAEERKAYKQKRLIGACAECKKRRRKVCLHSLHFGTSLPFCTFTDKISV
jgi:hypothetical protein